MTKATEQHRQKKTVNKMKLLLHLAEQFVKRVSIAVQAKSDLPRGFYPLTQSIKRQKGDFLSMFFLFFLFQLPCHISSKLRQFVFSKLSAEWPSGTKKRGDICTVCPRYSNFNFHKIRGW